MAADVADPPFRMRYDELAVLVAVAEAGSIAAAARRLGVPKSTVGRAIRRLEADLGAVLVRRAVQGPPLTEVGRTLVTHAAPHVAALRDVATAVSREMDEVHGALRITAPVDLAQVLLGPLVTGFLARHPKVSVEVDANIRMVDLVGEGFDLAIRVARRSLASSSLVAKKLARLDLGLYASPAYVARQGAPKRPSDLRHHDHVLLFGRQGRATLALEGPRETTNVEVSGPIAGNDFFFIRESIASGAGIGSLPWFVARSEIESGRLVRVLPDYQHAGTTAFVVHAPLRPLPAKTKAFRDYLLEHAPRLLAG